MPRGSRIDSPGLLHHVRFRGVERRDIFLDDTDRESFCSRLEDVCSGGSAEVLAWCLMSNHAHLAIRCGSMSLSSAMRRVLTGYAIHFNKRHGRVGHLFQNRYKSTVVESERYLAALVRYIHLNPVSAGLVGQMASLEEYEWCGHGALLGRPGRDFQRVDEVLARFGSSMDQARAELRMFMGDSRAAAAEVETFEGGGLKRSVGGRECLRRLQEDVRAGRAEKELHDARILGSSELVAKVLQGEEGRMHQPSVRQKERAWALLSLFERVVEVSGLTKAELQGGSRRKAAVSWRHIFAALAVTRLGASPTQAAELLGVTTSAVVKAVDKGRLLLIKLNVDEGRLVGGV